LFYIIHEWIGIQRVFILKQPQHEVQECETLVRSMDNLKQKEDVDGTRRPRCPKPLLVEAKTFMKVATKGYAFLLYVFPSPNVEPCPSTKNSRMCLKREM
jgi:hypothetical protein